MKRLWPSKTDVLERFANFMLIGSRKSQKLVFEDLKSAYHLKMKFVVLSLDMDKMEAGNLINNYETQITELFEVKKKFPNRLLPFISVDPRKDYPQGVGKYLEQKFKEYGFVGIKLYPALGYYPFNPELEPVYDFACKHNVPLMIHCTRAGIWFQGDIRTEHLLPENFNPKPVYNYDFTNQRKKKIKVKVFKDNFTKPENFVEILEQEKYRNLKICFAHFGGSSEILKSKKSGSDTPETNFYLNIKKLMEKYPNVYTDISYTLSKMKKVKSFIIPDIQNPVFRNRILFGTDFFMTIQEKSEKRLVNEFLDQISTDDFNQIAKTNANYYLKSDFYKP